MNPSSRPLRVVCVKAYPSLYRLTASLAAGHVQSVKMLLGSFEPVCPICAKYTNSVSLAYYPSRLHELLKVH